MDFSQQLSQRGHNRLCPVVAIFRDGKVLTGLRHYTPDKWKTISVWTVPGGRCDEGETVEQTLRREVAEEIGITDLAITRFLGEIPGSKEGDIVLVFSGTTKQEPRLMEPDKFSAWEWKDPQEISDFINTDLLQLIRTNN